MKFTLASWIRKRVELRSNSYTGRKDEIFFGEPLEKSQSKDEKKHQTKNLPAYKLITILDISKIEREHGNVSVVGFSSPEYTISLEWKLHKQTEHKNSQWHCKWDRGWSDWFIGRMFLLLTIFICFHASLLVNSQRQPWLRRVSPLVNVFQHVISK